MPEWMQAVAIAFIAASPGLWALWRSSRKDRISLVEMYEGMATRQAKRITELDLALAQQDAYIDELERGIMQLIDQLKAKKIKPVWEPKRRESNGKLHEPEKGTQPDHSSNRGGD